MIPLLFVKRHVGGRFWELIFDHESSGRAVLSIFKTDNQRVFFPEASVVFDSFESFLIHFKFQIISKM